jgi:hypothetical protein
VVANNTLAILASDFNIDKIHQQMYGIQSLELSNQSVDRKASKLPSFLQRVHEYQFAKAAIPVTIRHMKAFVALRAAANLFGAAPFLQTLGSGIMRKFIPAASNTFSINPTVINNAISIVWYMAMCANSRNIEIMN